MEDNVIDFEKYRKIKMKNETSLSELLESYGDYYTSINYDEDTETFSYSIDVDSIDKATKEFFDNMSETLKSILNDPEK